MKEQILHETEARFGLRMSKNPYITLLFHWIGLDLNFYLTFWVQILSYLPLFYEGTAAGFLALGSSHYRPCRPVPEGV